MNNPCEWASGTLSQAEATLALAVEVCEPAKNFYDAGYAHCVLAWLRLVQGRLKDVQAHRDLAIENLEKEFDLRYYAWAHAAACLANAWLGRWDEAIAEGEQELQLATDYSSDSLIAFSYWNLSFAYVCQGDLEKAIEMGNKAFDTAPTPADKAWALIPLGWANCRSGQTEQGISWLEQTVAANRAGGFVWGEIAALWLADGYLIANQFDHARETLAEIIPHYERTGMRFALGVAERLRGKLAQATEWKEVSRDTALAFFERSLRILDEIGAENEYAHSLAAVAHVYADGDENDLARDHYARALNIYDRLGTLDAPDEVRSNLEKLNG